MADEQQLLRITAVQAVGRAVTFTETGGEGSGTTGEGFDGGARNDAGQFGIGRRRRGWGRRGRWAGTTNGAGGVGVASSITGASVTRAGGGGSASVEGAAAGGSGGGGCGTVGHFWQRHGRHSQQQVAVVVPYVEMEMLRMDIRALAGSRNNKVCFMSHFAKSRRWDCHGKLLSRSKILLILRQVLGFKHHTIPQRSAPSGRHTLTKNPPYAGIGYIYDSTRDAFYAPQPYPSWTLNETTCYGSHLFADPDDGKSYEWNERYNELG